MFSDCFGCVFGLFRFVFGLFSDKMTNTISKLKPEDDICNVDESGRCFTTLSQQQIYLLLVKEETRRVISWIFNKIEEMLANADFDKSMVKMWFQTTIYYLNEVASDERDFDGMTRMVIAVFDILKMVLAPNVRPFINVEDCLSLVLVCREDILHMYRDNLVQVVPFIMDLNEIFIKLLKSLSSSDLFQFFKNWMTEISKFLSKELKREDFVNSIRHFKLVSELVDLVCKLQPTGYIPPWFLGTIPTMNEGWVEYYVSDLRQLYCQVFTTENTIQCQQTYLLQAQVNLV